MVHQLSAVMDAMVSTLFNGILGLMGADGKRLTGHLTLAAVGGYGRGELNPYSDVDIMFLHDGSVPVEAVEAFAQKLLYFLWICGWMWAFRYAPRPIVLRWRPRIPPSRPP